MYQPKFNYPILFFLFFCSSTLADSAFDFGTTYYSNETVTCTVNGRELYCSNGINYVQNSMTEGEWRLAFDIGMCIFLVSFSGIMSGLTMGLMSLDITHLKVIMKSGEPSAQRHAKTIMPLVEKHHLLLVTLLIGNSLAIESLPIFLDRLIGSFSAIILSVTLVLLFGEILPQAICTRYGLAIGANLSWLVWIMIVLFFIIAYPVSKLLDFLLGKDSGTFYRRGELKELVEMNDINSESNTDLLSKEEVSIIKGALDLKSKTVDSVMTPIEKVAMLSYDDKLDIQTCRKLVKDGHSRWPVYLNSKDNIIGMLLVKKLIMIDPRSETPVRSLQLRKLPHVNNTMNLFHMLKMFQQGKSHMAVVLDYCDFVSVKGIITLEDVVEELIGEEILDETDSTFLEEKVRSVNSYSSKKYSNFAIVEDYGIIKEDGYNSA